MNYTSYLLRRLVYMVVTLILSVGVSFLERKYTVDQ